MSDNQNGISVMAQGRIVWIGGNLFKGKVKTDFNTKQPIINAKTGQPQIEYAFGLAIPKSMLTQDKLGVGQPGYVWSAMYEETYRLYPSRQVPPAFAMKFKDGDTAVDDKGRSYSERAGYKEHIVLTCSTTIQPKFYRWENGQNIPITEGIKCGDYVDVQLNIKAHPAIGKGKPGLYINPMAVRFLGFGEEIVNTPSGDDIFGSAAPMMPPGASATPVGPQGFIQSPGQAVPPQMGQTPGFGQPAQQQGFAAPQAPVPQQPNYQPNYNVIPQSHQPAPQQQGYGQPAGNGFPPAGPAAPTMQQPQQGQTFAPPAQAFPGNPQTPQGFPQQGGFPIPGQGQ